MTGDASALANRQSLLDRHQQCMSQCRLCVDAGFIPDAWPVFHGRATNRVMVVGQAPAVRRLERPLPYSGATGQTLQAWLARAGFAPDALHSRFYLTSLTKCFPGTSASGKGDRAPSRAEIRLCLPHLERELELVRPRLILPLGRLSITYFAGSAPLAELVGRVQRRGEAHIVPLPHPSGVSHWLNQPEHRALLEQALDQLRQLRLELQLD